MQPPPDTKWRGRVPHDAPSTRRQQYAADSLVLTAPPPPEQQWLLPLDNQGGATRKGCLGGKVCQLYEMIPQEMIEIWLLTLSEDLPNTRGRKAGVWANPGRAASLGKHTICSHLFTLGCRLSNMLTAFEGTSRGLLYIQRNAGHPDCISSPWNQDTSL